MLEKILVRCARWFDAVYDEGDDELTTWKAPSAYRVLDYYLVDLNGDEDGTTLERYCEPLLDDITGPGALIPLHSHIFSIPLITFSHYDNIPPSLPYTPTGEMVKRLTDVFYIPKRSSRLHTKKWMKSTSVPPRFYCAALSGTIYGLKSGDIKTPLCFNMGDKGWIASTAPPPHLHRCCVTRKMIPDPKNGRILVHLSGPSLSHSALYAWYPEITSEHGSSWVCVEECFEETLWVSGTTLISFNNKSLLFFFYTDSDLFRAWSLDDHKFLDISWSNEFPKIDLRLVRATSMCYLGNNQLCLALSLPIPDGYDHNRIAFLVFEIKQSTNTDAKVKSVMPADDSSDSITLTHISSKTFRVYDIRFAIDITPLGE